MKKVFITGISGFAGSFLAEELLDKKQYEVHGTYLTKGSLQNISHIQKDLHLHELDLQNAEAISAIISSVKPDLIFHLAALPQTAASLKNPSQTIMNNVVVQINLLEAVKKAELSQTRMLVVSSADIYGSVSHDQLPITEQTPLNPINPYAVSKITQDFLGLQYFNSYKFPIVRVRPFNHIGPRQAPGFVIASFVKRIAEIEKGTSEPVLHVGNLHTKRDFTDVRDMVRAYVLALEKGEAGEVYNIGSGTSYEISDILNRLLALSTQKITIQRDDSLLRPNDIPELRADASKFVALTGWKPEISIDTTLQDTLDYWRNAIL